MRRRRWARLRRWLAALAVGLCGGAPAAAHDLWIEPANFAPPPRTVVGLSLLVGEGFAGEPLPLVPELVERFVVVDAAGQRSVAARRGSHPAGRLVVVDGAPQVVGYHSRASQVELPADRFAAYLAEEGLEAVAAWRAGRGESDLPARELFYRCAKSLLNPAGAGDALQGDRRLGFPLELVVEGDGRPDADGAAALRLLHDGRPLAGALVVALHRGAPRAARQAVRSDADGLVRLRFDAAGRWLVKAVHMVPAPAGSDAQWASYWASLTFEVSAGRNPSTDR